jgi:hypothetical protein
MVFFFFWGFFFFGVFFLQALAELKLGDEVLYTEPQDRVFPAEAYFVTLHSSKNSYVESFVSLLFS